MMLTGDAITKAEELAKKLGTQLNLNEFRWDDWIETKRCTTVGDYVQALEEEFWEKNDRAVPAHHETWRVGYWSLLKSLPLEKPLTPVLLEEWIPDKKTSVSRREHYVTCARWLARIAGIEIDVSNIPRSRPVNKRTLPSDDRIIEIYHSIDNPAYKWVFGMMAAYGLRDHEIFGLDISEYPEILIRRSAKEGARLTIPLWLEPEPWDLSNYTLPDRWAAAIGPQDWNSPTVSNSWLGAKVCRIFTKKENRKQVSRWGIHAYDLRHCFARRAKIMGLGEWESAKLMGHSESIHRRTYQHSFGDRVYVDIAKSKLKSTGI
jgi:integrase